MIGSLLQQIFLRSNHLSTAKAMDGSDGEYCRNADLSLVMPYGVR